MKKISVVTPVYCEEKNISRFYQEISKIAELNNQYLWEFLFVNDGSKDKSLEILHDLVKKDPRCVTVDLSRNFGKEIALTAGLSYCRGDAVICIDADLQHPPGYIHQMLEEWQKGADIVEMVRESTDKESFIRKLGSACFYKILHVISNTTIVSGTTDFRLIDRKVIDEFNKIGEKERMFRGLIDWLGFKKVRIPFKAAARLDGISVYSYSKLCNLALNSFISYSSAPLRLVGILGLVIMLFSGALFVWMVLAQIFTPRVFNYTPLAIFVVVNTFLIGIVLVALGLMSLYISKIYNETQNRPLYAVRQVLRNH